MDPDRWYAFEAGRQLGPMTWVALKARADTGRLRRDDFVWREGMPDWVPVGGVDGLLELQAPPLLGSPAPSAGSPAPSAGSPAPSAGSPAPGVGSLAPSVPAETGVEALASDVPELVYAGFWRRLAAYAIDNAILFALLMIGAFFGGLIAALLGSKPTGLPGFNVLLLTLSWIYFASQESSKHRATLGKRAIGIQVVDLHGRRIDFARASLRHVGKIVSAFTFLIGFLMAAFTIRKQALHDVMASCLVVRGRSATPTIPDHEAWANRNWGEARSRPTDGA